MAYCFNIIILKQKKTMPIYFIQEKLNNIIVVRTVYSENILLNCLCCVYMQLEDQQTLEEAITMATAAIQHSGLTSDQ